MSGDCVFESVTALSSDAESDVEATSKAAPKPALKRRGKRKNESLHESLADEAAIRAMLGRPKCHCKRKCLSQFSEDAAFEELRSFRSDWGSMHKLDQDQVDSSLLFG